MEIFLQKSKCKQNCNVEDDYIYKNMSHQKRNLLPCIANDE